MFGGSVPAPAVLIPVGQQEYDLRLPEKEARTGPAAVEELALPVSADRYLTHPVRATSSGSVKERKPDPRARLPNQSLLVV